MEPSKKQTFSGKSKKQILLRTSLAILFILMALFVVSAAVLYLKRDEIAGNILSGINNNKNGEIDFENISIDAVTQFPNISLTLLNVDIFEHHKFSEPDIKPFARIEKVYCGFDVIELIKGNIKVSKITLENGNLSLIHNSDSSFNFINTFMQKDTLKENTRLSSRQVRNSDNKNSEIKLSLNQIALINIRADYIDSIAGINTWTEISKLKSSLLFKDGFIESSANLNMYINKIKLSENHSFNNISVGLQTRIFFDRDKQTLSFDPSELQVNDAHFKMFGLIDFKDIANVDIKLNGIDKDQSLLHLYLTRSGLKNIREGDILFNGSINGSFREGIPNINFDFGITNLSITIPDVDHSIEHLNLSGKFHSGTKSDFSDATLKVDTINGKLPGGSIAGNLFVSNFTAPYLDYQIDLITNIRGFDKVFKLSKVSKLQGLIHFNDKYSGQFRPDSGWTNRRKGNFRLILDSLSFVLPDMNVSLLDGNVNGNLDTSYFRNLIFKTEKTDLLVNGKIYNLSQFIFDENREIFADFNIRSDMFDLPQFLSFDPKIGRSFPYKIKDLLLNLSVTTSRKKLKVYQVAPEINFNIKQLEATIMDFIPRVTINQGNFLLGESDSLLHLNFTDFDIKVAGSHLKTHVELFRPPDRSLDLHIDLDAQNLNLGKAFYFEENDTIPKLLNAGLNGNMNLSSHFRKIDSISHLKTLNFTSGFLTYTGLTDTLEFSKLYLDAQSINYKKKTNPLTNLSSRIILSAGKFKSSSLKTEDSQFQIIAKDGSFTIVPEKFALFGKEGNGKFIVNPFNDPPSYEINYRVNHFKIEDLLNNFTPKQYLTGRSDLSVELVFTGKKWKEISSTMKGRIHLSGDSLVLTGFDFDDFIKKYERSQRFTLADVGAVIIAGPLGLAVTKGTDFTRVLITNHEDSTLITKLYSYWAVQNGILKMYDVAFTTRENRMASKGWINVANDSLDITFAVVNPRGCSILSQNVHGSLKDPKLGDLEVVSKLLAPITNLVKNVFDPDCEPFYTGTLKGPVLPEK